MFSMILISSILLIVASLLAFVAYRIRGSHEDLTAGLAFVGGTVAVAFIVTSLVFVAEWSSAKRFSKMFNDRYGTTYTTDDMVWAGSEISKHYIQHCCCLDSEEPESEEE